MGLVRGGDKAPAPRRDYYEKTMGLVRGGDKAPAPRRDYYEGTVEFSRESESLSDHFFGFTDGIPDSSESSSSSSGEYGDYLEDDDEEPGNAEEKKAFWDSQEQLLQAALCRTSSIESKIRQATKQFLRELDLGSFRCECRRENVAGDYCRGCLRREICNGLLQKGFDCAICKSKWKSSQEIPSGEHTYLEVVDESNPKKGTVRVIIELNFRGEFEMARASEGYSQLTNRLPEVFVGKDERLKAVIKILCAAAKKCMKERKIHMGPWRKQKYMLAKWFGKCERSAPATNPLPAGLIARPQKPRASMLTVDLLGSMSGLRCAAALKVV